MNLSEIIASHDADPLLTTIQAARYLGVNPETVRRWIRKGAMPCVRIGPHGTKRILRSVVMAFRVELAECSTSQHECT